MNPRRLYRSHDRRLAGVAGGMADYLGIDPTVMRILWILAVLMSAGFAIVVYILFAIVMPDAPWAAYPYGPMWGPGAPPNQGWAPPTPGWTPPTTDSPQPGWGPASQGWTPPTADSPQSGWTSTAQGWQPPTQGWQPQQQGWPAPSPQTGEPTAAAAAASSQPAKPDEATTVVAPGPEVAETTDPGVQA